MIKILLILCSILLAVPSYAGMCIISSGSGSSTAGGTCDANTNEAGDRVDTYDNTNNIGSGEMDCMLYAADCTGNFGTAKLYHLASLDDCKMCVYNSADDATEHNPAAHDTLVGCSAATALQSGDTGWQSLTTKIAQASDSTKYYWVCIIGGTNGCSVRYESSAGVGTKKLYYDVGFTYASPPANLAGDGAWVEVADREMSFYVEIED
jgi:hypothetical protein